MVLAECTRSSRAFRRAIRRVMMVSFVSELHYMHVGGLIGSSPQEAQQGMKLKAPSPLQVPSRWEERFTRSSMLECPFRSDSRRSVNPLGCRLIALYELEPTILYHRTSQKVNISCDNYCVFDRTECYARSRFASVIKPQGGTNINVAIVRKVCGEG